MAKAMQTGYTVQVEGLDSLMRWLKEADPKLRRALARGLKDAASPVLEKARANARKIQNDGTYAESLSIASRKGGAQYVLKSTDPAAGVKEFAKPGATRRVRSSTQRARIRAGLSAGSGIRVGVPHRAHQPRVMVPAIEKSAEEVAGRIDRRLEEVLKEVENG